MQKCKEKRRMLLLQVLPFRAILEKKERGRPAAVTNMRVRHEKIFATLVHLTTNCWYEEGNDYHGKPSWIWANPGSSELRLDREMLGRYLEELREKGTNTLVLDLGDAVVLDSHPEIAVKGAYTKAELRALLDKMNDMGFEVIPKMNFSTTHDYWMGDYARMVSSPIYYRFVRDIIDEVSALFEPRFFHIGMDEEGYDLQKDYEYVVVRQKKLWWQDLYFYVDCVEKNGARAMMWSDYAREKPEEFIEKCPRSVVQCVWYYFNKYGDSVEDRFKIRTRPLLLLDQAGFDQIPFGSVSFDKDSLPLLVAYCKKRLTPSRFLGFGQTTWDPVLPDWQEELSVGADRLAEARAIFEAE